MSEEEESKKEPTVELVKRLTSNMAYEMRNQMHDGYVSHGYRVMLLEIRDHVIELLEK